jgi:hypothetical protein
MGSIIVEPVRYRDSVGWLGAEKAKDKVAEVRRLQQEVGQIMRRLYGDDFWVERLSDRIDDVVETGKCVIVPDIRFPNEVEMISWHRGYTTLVTRPGFEPLDHVTDQALADFEDWDFVLANDGDIPQLHERVDRMLTWINGELDVFETINLTEEYPIS